MTAIPVKKHPLRRKVISISIITLALAACAGNTQKAPIVDADPIPTHRIQKHVVSPGETLYSIALKYDLDYKKISQVNKLSRNHQIHPGQVLNLDVSSYKAPNPTPPKAQSTWKKPPAKVAGQPKNQTFSVPSEEIQVSSVGSVKWQWPIKGKVLEQFNANAGLNKGIDIRGKLGEPVNAAADGEVVYSGSGLRGYGKLLIVKHNEKYLSAYAHNRVLHVAEGDRVKAGQKIAEVGFSGTNSAKLHFEIRFDGKPVDPLKFLPKL